MLNFMFKPKILIGYITGKTNIPLGENLINKPTLIHNLRSSKLQHLFFRVRLNISALLSLVIFQHKLYHQYDHSHVEDRGRLKDEYTLKTKYA
jgi:hypothetical protein